MTSPTAPAPADLDQVIRAAIDALTAASHATDDPGREAGDSRRARLDGAAR